MLCHSDTGKCRHKPKCEHACNLRAQHVTAQLSALDHEARPLLLNIGERIGYGNAQDILGKLWDEMLTREYGVGGRGGMGVTANERAAFERGWDACMHVWADHMKRMAKAVGKKRP
jgi:hypothetical protein